MTLDDPMGANRPIDERVDFAIRRRAAELVLHARPFAVVMENAVQLHMQRDGHTTRSDQPNSSGSATASPDPVNVELTNALARRAQVSQPSPRPFQQVVGPPASAQARSAPPRTRPRQARNVRNRDAASERRDVPTNNPDPKGPSAGAEPARPAPDSSTPRSPTPRSSTARSVSPRRALKPQRHLRRTIGRIVTLFAVGTVVVTGVTAVWFFWGDIRCAFAQEPAEGPIDSCAAPDDTLRAAATDLLDAINEGDVARIRSHLPQRCSESDDELRRAAAKAAQRTPTITTVSVVGRGGTVNVESGQKEYVSLWLKIDGRWQLQICDVLDRLAES